jgi:hypothetical protein
LFRVVGANGHSPLRKYVESKIGDFPRNINRLPATGAKTWHFYYKDGKWCVAVSFTPSEVTQVSRSVDYGCIGIDMNPLSIGWAYIDAVGNLKSHGQIPLQTGLPKGKQQAQIVKACLELSALATKYQCPIVGEELDFSKKKEASVSYRRGLEVKTKAGLISFFRREKVEPSRTRLI